MKKNVLLIIAIIALCSSSAMAKKVTVSSLSFRAHMGEGLSVEQSNPVFLYSSKTDLGDFDLSIANLNLKQGHKIKKFFLYMKTNNVSGAIYPWLGYADIETGEVVNIVGTEAGQMPDIEDSYHIGNNPGSEISEISVPLKTSGHVVNNKKYIYFIVIAMSGGGGKDVSFYGAKIITK